MRIPADFEEQMRYVAAHYNVISSWDLVRSLRGGQRFAASRPDHHL